MDLEDREMLKTENIGVTLGGKKIISSISTHIKEKEFVGVIGPNGSGKSTLLKTIYRSIKPDEGQVLLMDQKMDSYSNKEIAKKTAVVAQHNQVNFDFTVKEMVLLGRSPYKKFMEQDSKKDYEIVEESLEKVGMGEYINRSFMTLSGGEQQRVILARALAQQTELILLDEPTNHLDIKYQFQLMNTVKNLGVTVLAIIHDLNIAAMYCDKIYCLDEGKICRYGTPEEVITTDFIEELYGVSSIVDKDEQGQIYIRYLNK